VPALVQHHVRRAARRTACSLFPSANYSHTPSSHWVTEASPVIGGLGVRTSSSAFPMAFPRRFGYKSANLSPPCP
jgi:hypothetical protein